MTEVSFAGRAELSRTIAQSLGEDSRGNLLCLAPFGSQDWRVDITVRGFGGISNVHISLPILCYRCETDVQTTLQTLTFEGLVTEQNGVHASRALVNVVINQQIGQQISVSLPPHRSAPINMFFHRLTLLVRSCNNDVVPSVVRMMSFSTRYLCVLFHVVNILNLLTGQRKCPEGS